jgi:excisionase family DNA binding protein
MSEVIILTKAELEEVVQSSLRKILNESPLGRPELPDIGDIEFAISITGLKKQTIYGKVCKGTIPFFKVGKLLRFSRTELINWMKEKNS